MIQTRGFAVYPLAQLAVAFALGIFLATRFGASPVPFILGSSAFTLAAALSVLTKSRSLTTLLLMTTFAMLGATLASIDKFVVPPNQIKQLIDAEVIKVDEPVELTGVMVRDPEIAPDRLYLQLRVQSIRKSSSQSASLEDHEVLGTVMLLASVRDQKQRQEFDRLDLRYGARLRVVTRLERAENFRNPGVSSFTEYLDRKGYDASAFVKSPRLIQRLESERVFPPFAWLYEWRRRLQAEIDARFATETAGVLDAAMLGNRYKLSHSVSERFRDGGTFHALVISGLHITFLGGIVFVIARRFTRNRVLQFLLSASVLWAYALAVGAESSVARAALMFTLLVLAPVLSRRATSLNVLGGTALMLLTWRPADLFDPSFQLTFASVIALVVFSWSLLEKLAAIGSWRPSRQTPYPPGCSAWLRAFCEALYWSERRAKEEFERANFSCKLFKSPFAGTLERLHLQRLFRYAFAAIVVSASVQLALLPFLIVYFHRVSLASLVLNIGVSVLMAAVAFFAAVALLIAQFSSALAAPFISLTNGLNWSMVHSVDPFASVGLASIRIPEYSGWPALVYVGYYAPMIFLAVSLGAWNPLRASALDPKSRLLNFRTVTRSAVVVQLLFVLVLVLHPWSAGQETGKLRVDFLDVGQGDAALVTFPDNTRLLVDGGGRAGPFQRQSVADEKGIEGGEFENETQGIGETVISEYSWWRGLDRVDYLLATHADADHIDGLNDVVRNFQVRAVLVARTPRSDPEFAKLSNTLERRGGPVYLIGGGDELQLGRATARVLSPLASTDSNKSSGNNYSIVLRLEFGERSFLFTGDIEKTAEERLLQMSQNLRTDVVKVPHHGSKTSSTAAFVAATAPEYAVFSVGQSSMFGHPHASVVERWRAGGAKTLTTGKSGTITFTTDGKTLEVETFVK